jgi:hypothetical protein
MSILNIRTALETALAAMSPPLDTAWENVRFTPVSGVPFQEVFLLLSRPENTEIGPRAAQRGVFQITLNYPLQSGPIAAATRAELIRTTFYRTRSLVAGSTTVNIDKTPDIRAGLRDGDRYTMIVEIRFYAAI